MTNATLPGVQYQPKNVVATFTDQYGEERSIPLECEPASLMPALCDVMRGAGVRARSAVTLEAA